MKVERRIVLTVNAGSLEPEDVLRFHAVIRRTVGMWSDFIEVEEEWDSVHIITTNSVAARNIEVSLDELEWEV